MRTEIDEPAIENGERVNRIVENLITDKTHR
jgi:hypothetical protein